MSGSTIPEAVLRTLHAPTRNRYFYGKLLDVRHFQMEQCYSLEKRWLLNRLTLGPGVLCGLGVTLGKDGTVCIAPGVAIDGLGREIIVTAPVPVDPAQPTDGFGKPSGDKLTAGQTTIYLCYTECDTDPTLFSIADCDGAPAPAFGSAEERFRIVVHTGVPGADPPELTDAQRDAIFPATLPAGFDRRIATEETLAIDCTASPDPACVVLATVTLAEGAAPVVDQYTYRPEVFSNTVLFELIAALAARVDACCAAHAKILSIAITGGEGQSARARMQAGEPVTLLVSDQDGNPVGGENVTLETTDQDGMLSVAGGAFAPSVPTTTPADGVIRADWQLGSVAGPQQFTATLASNGKSVTAHATATALDKPPVVLMVEPENGAEVPIRWIRSPRLTVVFDQEMDPGSIASPDGWLRAWWFRDLGNGRFSEAHRIRILPGDPPQGAEIAFPIERFAAEKFTVVLMMRGHSPEIVSAGLRLALDADFRGTRLTKAQLNRLWDQGDFQPNAAFAAAINPGPGSLPSGDGNEGGDYSGYFKAGA